MAIITAAEAKAYIPTLSSGSTADDTLLADLIGKFDQLAAAFMGYPQQNSGAVSIESGTYVERLDGPGGRELYLAAKPVTSITSIYDDPDQEYTAAADLVAASDYTLYGLEGLVMMDHDASEGTWRKGTRSAIQVTYVAGYSGGTMPQAIKHAACLQVAHWYGARAHIGRTNVSMGGQSANLMSLELLPETRQALNPYRLATCWVG